MLRRVVLAFALVLGVPAVTSASEAACPQAVLDVRGTNPSYASLGALLTAKAAAYGIPPQVLKAIAYKESTWRQFRSDGRPLISQFDDVCGIGVMQITLGSRTDGVKLASDVAYNVQEGAKILKQKWDGLQDQTHPAPQGYPLDAPDVIENWYASICRYNGTGGCNSAGDDLPYATPVARLVGDPFQQGVPAAIIASMPPGGFTTPQDADGTYSFPTGFQAQHDPDKFVFYDHTTGEVTKVVDAPTHLGSTPFPGYGAGTFGPNGPATSCTLCSFWRPAEGTGIAGWAHWTNSVTGNDAARVTWTPARTGQFDVSAYVPSLGIEPLAPQVTYHLGAATQTVDQNAAKGTWVSLGRRTLSPSSPVWLGDHSTVGGVKIVADALRLSVVTKVEILPSPLTVTYGRSTALTLRLSQAGGAGIVGRSLVLAKRPAGSSTWTNVGAYTTGADGRVVVNATPAVNTDYRVSYTATDSSTVSATPAVRRVYVAPKVTGILSRTSAPRGTRVTISARVTPAHAGQQVVLQRLVSGVWRNVTARTLSSTGTASFAVAPSSAGTYYYRLSKPADADHVTGVSTRLTLKVT